MSDIAPISRPNAAGPTLGSRLSGVSTPASSTSRPDDTVELSGAAQTAQSLLAKLREGTDLRHDLIDRVRQEIADGTYVTDDKVNASTDNLLNDLA
jgi:flagellar biosynthesis anti-sigma factor FlgM